jgi:hypothetical protein
MTDCNGQTVLFASLGAKRVQADFKGGRLTSDAGALLLREADKRIALIDAINRCITDPRQPDRIVHSQATLLAQRIFAIALGYEDLNDHDTLRSDAALQAATGHDPKDDDPLGSKSTLCRLENRMDRGALARIAEVFVEAFIASQTSPPEELILDFDATDDPLHGEQEGRFFHGYYDHYCYLPLYVYCGDQLLVAYLRPSNIDPSLHSRAILKMLVRRFRQHWPQARITVRADSAFCRWPLMRWCEHNNVHYIFGLARNKVLERLAERYAEQAQRDFEHTGQKQRIFGEVRYAAATWDRERRVIVKAERLQQGPNTRFVVTDIEGEPQQLYDGLYCQRGEAENRIKEQQLGLFADRTSCHAFLANQFRLFLSAAAYVLVETIRRVALKGTQLARAQVSTIRLKLFKIGARVLASVRRIVLHLASGYPLQRIFREVVERLRTAPVGAIGWG